MLSNLKIKNYALIENLEINFSDGLNIITGETGAGKSILIDALGLVLGERANNDAIRTGQEKAIVEAIFNIKKNQPITNFCKIYEIDFAEELILRREISIKGTSRSFVNDTPVQLNTLKSLGNLIVDLHGQHDHQSLLKSETHINFLDDYAQNEKQIENFKKEFQNISTLINQKNELTRNENELKQKKDLLEFQLQEILNVNPIADEEIELEKERKISEHSEKINLIGHEIYSVLNGEENSILSSLAIVKKRFDELKKIDESFGEKISELETSISIIKELIYEVEKIKDAQSFSEERLEEIRNRLGLISLLKKKFGGSIEAVLELKEKIKKELLLAENFDEEIKKIENKIVESRKNLSIISNEIYEARKRSAEKLEKEIILSLAELGIANGKFKVNISQNELEKNSDSQYFILRNGKKIEINSLGGEIIEFYLSANLGESPKKLVEVASGGEVSRIMLSLKSALAKADRIPTLIFDEIDTGISGRIGFSVGKKLLELAKIHQIISITHLPQIAALGVNHFVVEKIEHEKSTTTKIKKLNPEERISEIAKLLSGNKITESSLKSAKELIYQA